MNYFKKIVFFLFCVMTFYRLEGAVLHSFVVADTTDSSVGDSTAVDLIKVLRELRKVAQYTKMDHEQVIISGENVLPRNVLDSIEQLQFEEDDVVVFYYSGHGYRTENKEGNPWPNLYFSIVNEGIDLSYIRDILEDKNPRFLIVIADACNNCVPEDYAPPLIKKFWVNRAHEDILEANYSSLFMETEGTLLISSSEVGEYSWGTEGGGLFTVAFLQNLQKSLKSSEYPEWNTILDRTAQLIADLQHPLWDFTSKKDRVPTGN